MLSSLIYWKNQFIMFQIEFLNFLQIRQKPHYLSSIILKIYVYVNVFENKHCFLLLDSIYFILIYTLLDKHCQRMIKYVREWQSMQQYGSARQVLPETGSNRCNAIQSYSIRVRLRVIISVRVLELDLEYQILDLDLVTQTQ